MMHCETVLDIRQLKSVPKKVLYANKNNPKCIDYIAKTIRFC